MITNRLNKQAKKSDVLVEVSDKFQLPEPIAEFLQVLKSEKIAFKSSALPGYQVSFYYVVNRKSASYQGISIQEAPSQFQHAMTILYLNHENQSKIVLPELPGVRTLLLREDLENFFSLQYEIENVESKKDAANFLCEMCAGFINRASNRELDFFDQKVQGITKVKKNEQNILKDIWLNILFQIPGLGKQKCCKIVESFPTYQSIMKDYNGDQKLKDLVVGRAKTSKLGSIMAKRIYKVFLSTKFKDSVLD